MIALLGGLESFAQTHLGLLNEEEVKDIELEPWLNHLIGQKYLTKPEAVSYIVTKNQYLGGSDLIPLDRFLEQYREAEERRLQEKFGVKPLKIQIPTANDLEFIKSK